MAELSPKQQVVDILKNQKRFLILTHKSPDGDAIGSALALYATLLKLGKEAVVAISDPAPIIYNFLPEISEIKTDFSGTRDFVVSVDITNIKPDKVLYKVNGNKLDIIITPKIGQYEKSQLSCGVGGFNFDAIIILDSPDLERIGSLYEQNSEIFFEIPTVNIDHHAGNDHFGKINLVDITATSTAEILVSVIESLTGDSKFFDEQIATLLLCGIITDTNSFKNQNTTPKSLTVAAQLVAQGARQQEIVKNIYKTKPLSTLRLWGRALSSLHDEKDYRFVWTALYKKDFIELGATEEESGGLIDELLKTASGIEFALLLSEKNGDVHGSLRSTDRMKDVSEIAKLFEGGGHPLAAAFEIKDSSLMQSSSIILEKIKNYQRERLSMVEPTGETPAETPIEEE